jgi:sugar/nucleoside kinase (ribokinase family)
VKITRKFAPGLYRLIFTDGYLSKMSVPVYFYVTNGKDAETSQYREETGVYKSVGTGATLTNEVFQLPTTTYFHYLKDTGERVKESYSKTNKPVTFSSWIHAYDYIM